MKGKQGGRVAGDPCYIGRRDDLERWVRGMWINHDAAGYHYAQAENESLSRGLREYHADRASATLAKISRLMAKARFATEGMRREFFRRCDGVTRMTDDQRFVMGDGAVGKMAEFAE